MLSAREVVNSSSTNPLKKAREFSKVPFVEIEPLIEQISGSMSCSASEVLELIGYRSSSLISNWRDANQAPAIAKYALLGLAGECQLKLSAGSVKFSFDELADLFAVLRGQILEESVRKALIRKIIAGMMEE